MARVAVTRHLLPGALDPLDGHEILQHEHDDLWSATELAEAMQTCDAVVSLLNDRINAEVLGSSPRVRVVANVAVGFDNIDVPACTAAGVLACNTPGVLDDTTADLAFALILAAARRLSTTEAELRAGRWHGFGFANYLGVDVHGATLGLVGYGRIARAVARRATGFGMTVLHHSRTNSGEPGYIADLDDLLARSDFVSLHVPLTEHTRQLIGARELALMKRTAVLVNTARGPVVDENALADALEAGTIFAAGLDVFDGEPKVNPRILAAPNTVLVPHIGSASFATRLAMAQLACTSVAQALRGELPPTALNPEVANL